MELSAIQGSGFSIDIEAADKFLQKKEDPLTMCPPFKQVKELYIGL